MNKIALLVMFMLLAGITNISAQSEKDLQKAEKIMSKIRPCDIDDPFKPYPRIYKKLKETADLGHSFAKVKLAELLYYGASYYGPHDPKKAYEIFQELKE